MSIFFKDLGKKAKDLLGKKSFTTDGKKKFSIKTKTADGIGLSAESTVDGAKVNGKVKCDYKCNDSGVNFKNISLDTSGCSEAEITVDKVVDNVLFTLSKTSSKGTALEGDFGFEYSHEDFKAKFVAAPVCKNTANASICFKQKDFFVGGAAGVNYGEGFDVDSYNFGVGYAFDENVATLNVCDKLSKFKLSGHRQHSADVALAGTLTSTLDCDIASNIGIEVGYSYKIDSDTTTYGKVTAPNIGTKDLKASFSLGHKLNANTSLNLTSVLDLDNEHPQNFLGSQFGLELKFGS